MKHTHRTPPPEDSFLFAIVMSCLVISMWAWLLWKMFDALTN
jgi:hypothetical protein